MIFSESIYIKALKLILSETQTYGEIQEGFSVKCINVIKLIIMFLAYILVSQWLINILSSLRQEKK